MDPYHLEEYQPEIPHDTLLSILDSIPPNDTNRRKKFWTDVTTEIQTFEAYCNQAYATIGTKLWSVIRQFAIPQQDVESIEKLADSLAEVIVDLNDLIGNNFKFYVDLKHKFDLASDSKSKSTFAEELIRDYKFCNMYFGDHLCMLSDIYSSIMKKKGDADIWTGSRRVQTKKFFVRYEDVTRIKLAIVKNLPLMRAGKPQGVKQAQDKPGRRYSGFAHLDNSYSNDGEGDSVRVTSIYLDTDKLRHYHDKIFRREGATQLRVRFESNQDDDDKKCTIERKTESFALRDSVKDDFKIAWDQVGDYLNGKLKRKHLKGKRDGGVLEEIQKYIVKHGLRPKIRAHYHSTKFQLENNNNIVISLNAGIEYCTEPKNPGNGRWCRDMSNGVSGDEGFIFPLAVLDVKTSIQPPEWLESLLSSPLVISAYKFNKYAHGCGKLEGLKVKVLPNWFNRAPVHVRGFPWRQWYRQLSNVDEGISLSTGLPAPSEKKGKVTRQSKMRRTESASIVSLDSSGSDSDDTAIKLSNRASWQRKPSEGSDGTSRIIVNDIKEKPSEVPKPEQPAAPVVGGPIWGRTGGDNAKIPERHPPKGPLQKLVAFFKRDKSDKDAGTPTLQAVRVEPKTYFANERTLLQWLNVAILLAIGGAAFMSFSTVTPPFIGIGILVFALLFAMYSLGVYHYRRNAVASKSVDGHYDDKWGPTILVIMLFIYLIAAVVFALLYPAGTLIVGPTIIRDYRIPILNATLHSDSSVENILSNLYNEITNRMPQFTYSGVLQNTLGVMNVSYWDTRYSCVLRKNGYRLREIVGYDPTGQYFSLNSKFEYKGDDGQFASRLDSTYPYAGFIASEYVQPPYKLQYGRELNSTNPVEDYPRLAALANEFHEFFLWDTVSELNWVEPLEKVNNIELQLRHYGTVYIPFGSLGRMGELNAFIWYYSFGLPVYGELSLSLYVYPGTDLSKLEIQQTREFFAGLQSLASLSPQSQDISNFFYDLEPYCN